MVDNDKNIVWHKGKLTAEDRAKIMGQNAKVLWFTGLSGSGKSTIAVEVEKRLCQAGKKAYRLDGDNVRHGLSADLGFEQADRNENIRRVTELAALFKDSGMITLVSFISPFEKTRAKAREIIGTADFIEIYVNASIETCAKRDPKGLYKKAQEGLIENFTGISSPYEEPKNAEITLDTNTQSIEESVEIVLNYLSANQS